MARPRETKGSRTLRADARTNEALKALIAKEGHACTVKAIDNWRHGRASPELGARVAMAQAGIVAFNLWDELPGVAQAREPAPEAPELPSDARAATVALADRLSREADRQLRALEGDTTPDETGARGRQLRELAATIAQLGKITGVTLDERVVLRSPALRVIRDAIDRALLPWPEAAQAVVEALRELESEAA